MSRFSRLSPSEKLVRHVHELEHLAEEKAAASAAMTEAFETARLDGLDPATLKVVLKLRQLTPLQREERRALEAIYLAALGMLEGESLPDAARRRLDGQPPPAARKEDPAQEDPADQEADPDQADAPAPPVPPQPALPLKTPEEARQEGKDAAAAGKRIYDNPFPAGDPCRAAWDEGWCLQKKSNGMEPPAAFQRKVEKPAKDDKGDDKKGGE